MSRRLRVIKDPFLVPAPGGRRVRTRIPATAQDLVVLLALGRHLGHLASADLKARCQSGEGEAGRTRRKRTLTPACSSRWAGAITRRSEDQFQLAYRNALAEIAMLRASINRIERRLRIGCGERRGQVRGYASAAERYEEHREARDISE